MVYEPINILSNSFINHLSNSFYDIDIGDGLWTRIHRVTNVEVLLEVSSAMELMTPVSMELMVDSLW
jgi:hypothetical protein